MQDQCLWARRVSRDILRWRVQVARTVAPAGTRQHEKCRNMTLPNASDFRSTLHRLGLALSVLILATLAGCAATTEETYVEKGPEPFYNEAMDALEAGRYVEAREGFNEVERQHPYSIWATRAQLMSAYSSYQANDYVEAILALDRFIRLHPGNRDIAYAYYLRALCHYEQITDIGRDQTSTQKAMQALSEVLRRFPQTSYARDARLKIDLTLDHLAGKDMEVGRFYLQEKKYLAAINRFRRVVDEYQRTSHVPEALHRLVEAYTALGLGVEAQRVAAVLGHNFPGSSWYADSYELAGKKTPAPQEKKGVAGFLDRIF